jgi:glutamate synthase (NADPH/NADH) small chain
MTHSEKKTPKLDPQERKERMKVKRHGMTEQDPVARGHNFNEVNLGYDTKTAIAEAKRCIYCPVSRCVKNCPVNIDIPGFLTLVSEGKFMDALELIKRENALPAITGRVCPQEIQCEGTCTLDKTEKGAVAIGYLERFVADYERNSPEKCHIKIAPATGKKVAIVGSGPAGLTVAADLARLGHEVHIFEAFHKPGGVLIYGIPEFRLPKEIVEYEIKELQQMGVKIHYDHVIGTIYTIKELLDKKGFNAIFIGIGAGLPRFLGIPGENLNGVYSANEYLTRSNLMKAYDFPTHDTPIKKGKNVTVVGGGNVAMDAARTALRMGAKKVHIVYRRSPQEMPARKEEIIHAEEEGIDFKLLTNPVSLEGDEKGWVKTMKCVRMRLGEADSSGRRRPIPIENSDFSIITDLVIIAIGAGANPLLTATTPDLKLNRWGYIVADEQGKTSMEKVWAGGDIVTGAATVISAMGAGKKSACDIHEYLCEKQ